jgi:hypothetical protein
MASTSPLSTYSVKELLENVGYELTQPDGARDAHGDDTPPLIFDEPIGGNDDLRRWLARNAH